MKKCCLLITVVLSTALSPLAGLSSEEMILKNLKAALDNMSRARNSSSNVSVVEFFQYKRELAGVFTQVVAHAFADVKYDQPDSFLASLLKAPDIAEAAVPQICIMQFPKTSVGNGERGRLCNFLIKALYEHRTANASAYQSIKSVIYFNDYPEVYSPETREIVKKLILEGKLHFFYADVVGVTRDKEIQAYLLPIANREGRYKEGAYYQSWLATCMLAKIGDKAARKRVEDESVSMSDLDKAMYIPLGMAYLGDREMVLRLFSMLKSDLKEWNGEDVMPKETQLAHEAAAVLSLCIKSFPQYKTSLRFSAEDKANCLRWVEDHKETFVIENKPPLYFLKNTRFGFLTR